MYLIVLILITGALAFQFIGGELPQLKSNKTGVPVVIVTSPPQNAKSNLQLYTFLGITVTPSPTPTPIPTPISISISIPTPTPPAPTPTPTPTPTPQSNLTGCGADSNPTGNPIGGGAGYTKTINQTSAKYLVSTKAQLLSALSSATSGQIVYIEDSAQINMSGSSNIIIPGGVTLASGRGNAGSPGGLLYVSSTSFPNPLFKTGGANVRMTGLRLQGPSSTTASTGDATGFHIGHANGEVDNCEISAWTLDGIRAQGINGYVHHNNIHHNQMDDLGYGVETGNSTITNPVSVLIEANLFDWNRHSIAAEGDLGSSYEARYNIVGVNQTDGIFDRHGTANPGSWNGGDGGDTTYIHHNTIKCVTEPAISIRGEPRLESRITNNWFYNTKTTWSPGAFEVYNRAGSTVMITATTCPANGITAKNLIICDNCYGTTVP